MRTYFLCCFLVWVLFLSPSCIRRVQPKEVVANFSFDTADINLSVSPLDDFDEFVNGKWRDTVHIPNGYSSWGVFNVLHNDVEQKIHSLVLKFLNDSQAPHTPAQQIVDLYQSYMDTALVTQKGLQPLQSMLQEIGALSSTQALMSLFFWKYTKHFSHFIDFGVQADAQNSKANAVYLVQGGLSMRDRDYYILNNERQVYIQNAFKNYVATLLSSAGFLPAKARQEAENIYALEKQAALLQLPKEVLRDPVKTYHKVALSQLVFQYPYFELDKMMSSTQKKIDTLIIQDSIYLRSLYALLQQTSVQTLRSWYQYKLLSAYAPYLPFAIRDAHRYFYEEVMNGVKTQKPLEKKALIFVNEHLGNAVGKLFVEAYFPESSKRRVSEMIENMRLVYKDRLEKNTWMSEETKKNALKKLASFTYKIGYPKRWKDYRSLDIRKQELIQNVMQIREWSFKEMSQKIGQAVDKDEWQMEPQEVNAYYNPLANEIVFPAAILQPPFYNPSADAAMNYGGILAVIGHELTHGFDDEGSQYDEEGNLKVWWMAQDRKKFMQKADSLALVYAQFDKLKSGAKINAQFTLGENIADLGGLTLAYYALLQEVARQGIPKDIDGYTYKQRFFLSWARVWRRVDTEEFERNQVMIDPHAPAKARIDVPTILMNEFRTAWAVPSFTKNKKALPPVVTIW